MKKSLLALVLAMALVLCMLAGCGNSASSAAASETSAAAESAASEAEAAPGEAATEEAATEEAAPAEAEASTPAAEASAEEAAPAEEANSIDPDWVAPEVTYPIVEEEETLTYWQAWPPFLSAISEPSDAAMFTALEEATGIKLEITAVSTETSADDFMLRCASGDLTDMIQKGAANYTGGGAKAIEDEVIIDLLEPMKEYMPNYYGLLISDPNIYKNCVNDEGQIPALIGMYTDYYYTDQGFFIRQDLLDSVGKETPTTIAELDEVLAAFKDSGMTDPIVVLSEGKCDFLARAYGAVDEVIDGQIHWADGTDEMKAFLQKMHEYYEAGYINKDFVTYTDSDTKPPEDVVLSDNAGIFNEDVASISGYYLSTTNSNFNLAPLAQVRLEEGQQLTTGYVGVMASDKYSLSVSTKCEHVDWALEYMDYLFSDAGFELANYGTEGVTYTKNGDEYEFTDLILNNDQGLDWQLCLSLYINPGFPCRTDLSIEQSTYNDCQKAAVSTWVAAYDSSENTYPNSNWLSYTNDESETRADLQSDLETYQEEMRLKFITGQADIDAEWDEYCEKLDTLGFYELEEIDQAAYERYLAK